MDLGFRFWGIISMLFFLLDSQRVGSLPLVVLGINVLLSRTQSFFSEFRGGLKLGFTMMYQYIFCDGLAASLSMPFSTQYSTLVMLIKVLSLLNFKGKIIVMGYNLRPMKYKIKYI